MIDTHCCGKENSYFGSVEVLHLFSSCAPLQRSKKRLSLMLHVAITCLSPSFQTLSKIYTRHDVIISKSLFTHVRTLNCVQMKTNKAGLIYTFIWSLTLLKRIKV